MPHLRFRAVDIETVQGISTRLVADLCTLTGGKPEFVTLECLTHPFVRDGAQARGNPFVELVWFARPQAQQDEAAALITRHLKQALGEQTYVVVQVLPIDKSAYYSNGEHY
ncbi:DUF1904 family protein [Aeromonas rivuli]|jgi:hypothetical protein|uniref:DUF1904 family protein n=1 Tax=Aeromonas TaxID=642 RepID=UPI0005AA9918|nr:MULTISPECIES: DUF1904 family protein [Aeromonas]MCS3459681.1 hypothetical protein [Aeromonas sp. BIGb0445]